MNTDKWGYKFLIDKKTLWEKKKLLVTSNFFFSHNVFKSCLLLMRYSEYLWNKGLTNMGKLFDTEIVYDKKQQNVFFFVLWRTCAFMNINQLQKFGNLHVQK